MISSRTAARLGAAVAALCLVVALLLVLRELLSEAPSVNRRPSEEEGEEAIDLPARLAPGGRPGTAPPPIPRSADGSAAFEAWFRDRPELEGDTKFQRRLSLGTELVSLREALAAGEVVEADATMRLHVRARREDGLLRLDALSTGPSGVLERLRYLTEPRRDPDGLVLTTLVDTEDPLGRGVRLRIWTNDRPYEASHVGEADDLLDRLARTVGSNETGGGYDVLATATMGEDVFPSARVQRPFPVAGYYAIADDVCVVRTGYEDDFQRILLRHELVHAWHLRWMPRWQSRFLAEGLAEYLSRLEGQDPGLSIPYARLADEMAALVRIVQNLGAYGIDLARLDLGSLIRSGPREVYALGHLAYLLGLASVAAVGGSVIEEALGARNEAELAEAVENLGLEGVLAFARRHARGGRASGAIVIQDAGPEADPTQAPSERDLPQATSVLGRLGADVPAQAHPRALEILTAIPTELPLQDAERLRRVLDLLGAAASVRLLTETTDALEAPFSFLTPTPDLIQPLDPARLDGKTRIAFVNGLHASLEQAKRAPVALVGVHEAVYSTRLPLVLTNRPFRPEALIQGAGWSGAGDALVVTVASARRREPGEREPASEEEGRRGESLYYAALLRQRGVRAAAVLVVDLSDGQGAAQALAEAFALHLGPGAAVAYWNPQQALR